MDLAALSLPFIGAVLFSATLLIGIFGARLTRIADQLADATGWGEALMGGVFLGGATSLSGIITSVTAAADGHADLAVSNAVGGIAAQTVFLAVADMVYRRANLEHAASSLANMLQGALLVALLALPLLAMAGPPMSLVGVLFTAVCTSLPELVTSVAAVRRGALTLAVGGIIGGNCFDVLFLSFADFAHLQSSIYHAIGPQQVYIIALTLLLTGILLMRLLRREKHGIANIGFESFLIVVSYLGAMAVLVACG